MLHIGELRISMFPCATSVCSTVVVPLYGAGAGRLTPMPLCCAPDAGALSLAAAAACCTPHAGLNTCISVIPTLADADAVPMLLAAKSTVVRTMFA